MIYITSIVHQDIWCSITFLSSSGSSYYIFHEGKKILIPNCLGSREDNNMVYGYIIIESIILSSNLYYTYVIVIEIHIYKCKLYVYSSWQLLFGITGETIPVQSWCESISTSMVNFDDFFGRRINKLMVISLECDSHYLTCHKKSRLLFALLQAM